MKLLYISDNTFFCAGVDAAEASYVTITSMESINSLSIELLLEFFPVVFIDNIHMRLKVIEKIKLVRDGYGIMMRELSDLEVFKLDEVIYFSETYSSTKLLHLIAHSQRRYYARLTERELQVLSEIHNANSDIAHRLNISVKTVSAHKMKIQEKLMFGSKNNMMLCKLKATLDVSYFGVDKNSDNISYDFTSIS